MLILYILFAFLGQQTTDIGQQTSSTVAEPVEAPDDVVVPSTSSGTCTDTLNVSSIEFNEDARPCVSTGDSALLCDSASFFYFIFKKMLRFLKLNYKLCRT